MIYILRQENTNIVKIGFSTNNKTLRTRIKAIQANCPNRLKLEAKMNGSKLKERYLHSLCFKRRIRNEWFNLTKEEVARMIEKYKNFAPTKNNIFKVSQVNHL